MNYEIQSRSDFMTGSCLVVKIPENEIDQNALLTAKADCPDFILPFHYKNTDGQVEIVYKIGSLSKLQHLSGNLTSVEYAGLWQSLLKPLLVCGDWFMNAGSFILKAEHLYYDKNKKAIKYVYIPSAYGLSGHDSFYEMAVEVSKMMTVSDAALENKVLRAIIKDFNPMEFLKMLSLHMTENAENPENPEGNNSFDAALSNYEKEMQKIPSERADVTQKTTAISSGPGLRCVGRANLPSLIQVQIAIGEFFTIGRHVSGIGKRQSDFEFDKKTKAVSQRHSVIERDVDGYRIIDLSSNAGTFINGEKVPPNTPVSLDTGTRISFGNSGTDYIWEDS